MNKELAGMVIFSAAHATRVAALAQMPSMWALIFPL